MLLTIECVDGTLKDAWVPILSVSLGSGTCVKEDECVCLYCCLYLRSC